MQATSPARPGRPIDPETPQRRDRLGARVAAIGTRNLVRFARWRGRKDAERELHRRTQPSFRGFIQINLIRPS